MADDLIHHLPVELANKLSGRTWNRINVGCSAAQVFRLDNPNNSSLYLKVNLDRTENQLRAEATRLEWLRNKLPVSHVHFFSEDDAGEFLLMSEVPGRDASEWCHQANPVQLVSVLAAGLRLIHSVSVDNCPFDQTLRTQLAAAQIRVARGLVDEEDFDPERLGATAHQLFEVLLQTRPASEDVVFTHGDYCLPNIIVNQNKVSGFVDWGRAGAADRYQDLALAARSLTDNVGAEWVPLLLREYGIETPDNAKLEFYQLLDEFF